MSGQALWNPGQKRAPGHPTGMTGMNASEVTEKG